MIATATPRRTIGCSEQRIDLRPHEEVDGAPLESLVRHREDALDQTCVLWLLKRGVSEERPDRCKAHVSAAGAVAALGLDVVEEGADQRCVEIGEVQRGWGLLESLLRERDEQPKRIAIARDRVGLARRC